MPFNIRIENEDIDIGLQRIDYENGNKALTARQHVFLKNGHHWLVKVKINVMRQK